MDGARENKERDMVARDCVTDDEAREQRENYQSKLGRGDADVWPPTSRWQPRL